MQAVYPTLSFKKLSILSVILLCLLQSQQTHTGAVVINTLVFVKAVRGAHVLLGPEHPWSWTAKVRCFEADMFHWLTKHVLGLVLGQVRAGREMARPGCMVEWLVVQGGGWLMLGICHTCFHDMVSGTN